MPRTAPTLTLTGVVLMMLMAIGPLFGEANNQESAKPGNPSEGAHVHIDLASGESLDGTLKLASISLRTETETRLLDLIHLRRITFSTDPANAAHDSVQLEDKSVAHGRVITEEYPTRVGNQDRLLRRAEIREIRIVKDEQQSLLAILLGLLTLTAMEIVLGVDNVIFLAIVTSKLPAAQQPRARQLGLGAALGTRLLLLGSLWFLLGLTTPLFTLPDLPLLHELEAREVSWRDLILLGGGMFLIGKSVLEMHEKMEHAKHEEAGTAKPARPASFARTIATIAVIDVVFSLDSVITAVGMVEQIWVMIVAMLLSMVVMLIFSGPIARFVDRHPTVKVLALAFLILIGVMLVAEGFGQHMNKGYIYFAMAFAVGIEVINMRLRRKTKAAPAIVAS